MTESTGITQLSFGQSFITFDDSRLIRRFGNLTATASIEVLVSSRAYNEQSSQAQRSISSTSALDKSGSTGAKQVRLTYLDSNYVKFTEDILVNGTTVAITTASNIRFVESFDVIQGADAVGAITLWSQTNGSGTAICAISSATSQSFLCHHYVPSGSQCRVLAWNVVADDETNVKLMGQDRFGSGSVNLVQRVLDLDNMRNGNLANPNRLEFTRELQGVTLPAQTYVRITAVPLFPTSSVIRSTLYLWEDVA